jgi:CII-binding regulator of phage lambda lysogenization HflD
MSLTFKVSFDIYDFEDSEFLQDLEKVSKYYDNVIVLEHKLNKEKLTKQFETLSDVVQNIKDDNIQFGNLIFYNFDIPAIKRKLKERNL